MPRVKRKKPYSPGRAHDRRSQDLPYNAEVAAIEVDDPLASVHQVTVLARHRKATGSPHPHHVGAQVREHHRCVRPGSDTAQFDYSHPGEGSGVGHTQHSRTAMSACAKSISRETSGPS